MVVREVIRGVVRWRCAPCGCREWERDDAYTALRALCERHFLVIRRDGRDDQSARVAKLNETQLCKELERLELARHADP